MIQRRLAAHVAREALGRQSLRKADARAQEKLSRHRKLLGLKELEALNEGGPARANGEQSAEHERAHATPVLAGAKSGGRTVLIGVAGVGRS
eukprot:5096476-Prymnesium_polylepis.1